MSGQEILIEQLRAEVERLTAERDAAFELGRLVGRADVAKYARAIGEIESVVGIVGAVPMPQTVQAVRDLVSRAEKAERFVATADSEWKARAEKAEREFADRLDHLTAAVKRGDVLQARVTELEKRLAASRAIVDDLKSTIRREEVRGDTAIRERDEARANYAFMVKRAADQKLDGYRELGARAAAAEERAEKAERERDEARAERDRRPDISAEDAAHAIQFFRGWDAPGSVTDRVFAALRAHAAKVKP